MSPYPRPCPAWWHVTMWLTWDTLDLHLNETLMLKPMVVSKDLLSLFLIGLRLWSASQKPSVKILKWHEIWYAMHSVWPASILTKVTCQWSMRIVGDTCQSEECTNDANNDYFVMLLNTYATILCNIECEIGVCPFPCPCLTAVYLFWLSINNCWVSINVIICA